MSHNLQVGPEDEDEEDGSAADIDAQRKGKCVVLKTSTRQTIFLPVSTGPTTLALISVNHKNKVSVLCFSFRSWVLWTL